MSIILWCFWRLESCSATEMRVFLPFQCQRDLSSLHLSLLKGKGFLWLWCRIYHRHICRCLKCPMTHKILLNVCGLAVLLLLESIFSTSTLHPSFLGTQFLDEERNFYLFFFLSANKTYDFLGTITSGESSNMLCCSSIQLVKYSFNIKVSWVNSALWSPPSLVSLCTLWTMLFSADNTSYFPSLPQEPQDLESTSLMGYVQHWSLLQLIVNLLSSIQTCAFLAIKTSVSYNIMKCTPCPTS